MLPYAPSDSDDDIRHKYSIKTLYAHMVADYAHMTIEAVQQLDVIDYLILRRDAVISAFSKTEKGTEYLNNAWAYAQTEPDRAMLRKEFGMTKLEA